MQRAEAALKERDRHTVLSKEEFNNAKTALAYGCIKYADLCKNRINDYVFSFDKVCCIYYIFLSFPLYVVPIKFLRFKSGKR